MLHMSVKIKMKKRILRKLRKTGTGVTALLLCFFSIPFSFDRIPENEARPERIVSCAPNITEILFSLGAGDRLVGVTNFCTYPPEATSRVKIGGFSNPNTEIIISLKPDLIIAGPNVGNREPIQWLMDHTDIPLLLVEIENLSDLYFAILAIGRAVHENMSASILSDRIKSDIESIKARSTSRERKRVLISLSIDPVIAASPDSYPGALAEIAGADLVPFDDDRLRTSRHYPVVSMEKIIQSDPDIIIQTLMDAEDSSAKGILTDFWKKWDSISAVRKGKVFIVPGDMILRPSPRVSEGIKLLLNLIREENETP